MRRLLVFALLLLANRAYAYDAPGHFYTVTYALEELNPPTPSWDRDRNVIAFCTWLPDASVELSATSVLTAAASSYSSATGADLNGWFAFKMVVLHPLGTWGVSGCPFHSDPGRIDFDPSTMQPVVIVQQFIHGLTGGDPATIRSVAVDLASSLWNQAKQESEGQKRTDLLCATGFAMHLLGDSYAHRHLLDKAHASEAPMYPTGCGHASAPDGGHRPDHPLDFGQRWKDWQGYFADIATVFGSNFKDNATLWFNQLSPPQSTSDENECLLEDTLWGHIDSTLAVPPTDCGHPGYLPGPDLGIPCQQYVQNSAAKNLIAAQPSCKAAWTSYKAAAIPLFARLHPIAPEFDYEGTSFGMKDFYQGAEPSWP